MTYIVTKTIKGIGYQYEYESYRQNGKTKSRMIRYLGRADKLGSTNNKSIIHAFAFAKALQDFVNKVNQ